MRLSDGNEESLASRSDSGIDTEDPADPQPSKKLKRQPSHSKGDDPLSDPRIRRILIDLNITGPQLIAMSVKELNKRLVNCPSSMIEMLKRCRRTMKNRGYAKSCRVKRIAAKNQLEQINKKLVKENRELKQRNRSLTDQITLLQNKQHASPPTDRSIGNSINSSQLVAIGTTTKESTYQMGCHPDIIKRETTLPIDEQDSELLSLYECADSYPAGVELDQIAQSIIADSFGSQLFGAN